MRVVAISSAVMLESGRKKNLSPFLFSIFLNDLEASLNSNGVSGVNINVTPDDIHIFLKLLLLLYADDTVMFSDDKDTLQYALNVLKTTVMSGT